MLLNVPFDRKMSDLAIKDIAEQTGIAAGTIRMWEQRYGFPLPGAHRERLPALRAPATSRRCAACRPTATAGCPCPRRSSGRARAAARPTARRSTRPSPSSGARPAPAGAAQVDADRAQPRDRARGARARGVARADRRLPARAASTARSSRATGGSRASPTRPSCSPTSRASASRAAARSRSRSRRQTSLGQRVGGRHRRPGLRGLPARLGAARQRPSPATRTTSTAASRRSGRSARPRRGAPRWSPRAWRRASTPSTAQRLEQLLADRPMALEEPAPALTALTNRLRRLPRSGLDGDPA